MFKKLIGLFIFSMACATGFSQTFSVQGVINDSITRQGLTGVTVVLTNFRDSTKKYYAASDINGKFRIENISAGGYKMEASYIGYLKLIKMLRVQEDLNLGTMLMAENAVLLIGGDVTGRMAPVTIKGDTAEMNAGSYQTNPDANAEDLVKKMPGVTIENGKVQAQGEEVKKVLVDGKEFFGDDPTQTLRNMPADMIDKVQVFDRMSDQSAFTGVDDGNSAKTINIITKKDRKEGVFGRVYGSYGTDDRYNGGFSYNYMKNSHRLTLLGMSNNINQQNFASQDLLGVNSGGGQRGMGGPGMMGGGASSNFLVGQQKGISNTHSTGFNYSGDLGKKVKLTASYFFSNAENNNDQNLTRTTFLSGDSSQLYAEKSINRSYTNSHRANVRLEYNIDSLNSIIWSPKINWQTTNTANNLSGGSQLQTEQVLNSLTNSNASQSEGFSASSDLLYRHKFKKERRTFSLNLTGSQNDKNATSQLLSINSFYTGNNTFSDSIDQRANTDNSQLSLTSRATYTEPLGKSGIVELSYGYDYTLNNSEKITNNNDAGNYTMLDTTLSNKFDNEYKAHRAGISVDYNLTKAFSVSVGADYQVAQLEARQLFPIDNTINRPFVNFLPNARVTYKFSEKSNIRMRYRTRTNIPSLSQLQNVPNNTNPLLLTTGNPQLTQEFAHIVFGRYMLTNPVKARSLFIMGFAQHIQNYIGNATYIAQSDTTIEGIALKRGGQLSRPVNLDGYLSVRSFLMYSLPLKPIKSNLNTTTGVTYTRTPSRINNATNFSNSTGLSQGITLGSNISQFVDFTLTYNANYTLVKNTVQPQLDNNFFFHTAGAKLNLIFWKGLIFRTEATQTLYTGLSNSFNQDYLLWNASLGKKFLKNQSLEFSISVFDILKQNNSISRTVSESYVEDTRSQVLQQYFMINLAYTFRKFKGGADKDLEKEQDKKPDWMPQHPHGR